MKKIIIAVLLIGMMLILASCRVGNRQVGLDTVQTFDRYKIVLDDTTIEGEVKTWRDFDDSDAVQITDTNGITYLTHYKNVLLMRGVQ